MSITLTPCRVVVLVKAIPHPSRRYGETVCCAGVTENRQWKRLFPVRFRRMKEKFSRWDWIDFRYSVPRDDRRSESCRVAHESLSVSGKLPFKERAGFLEPLIRPSWKAAANAGETLALIRPRNIRFYHRPKSREAIAKEREGYERATAQGDIFERKDLAALEPVPYIFRFRYSDADGVHHGTCEDWETNATFWKFRRERSEQEALNHLRNVYNEEYPARGVAFAMGNMKTRPQTWLLLGVVRLDEPKQLGFNL